MNALGVVSGGGSPAEFGAYLHEQIEAYARIVRDAHIKLGS